MPDQQIASQHRMTCLLATDAVVLPSGPSICALLAQHFGLDATPATRLSSEPTHVDNRDGVILTIGQAHVAIVAIPTPLPSEVWRQAVELDRFWPDANKVMQSHKSHLIISSVEAANSHAEALTSARLVTFVAVAVAMEAKSSANALVWSNGHTIIQPGSFVESAKQMMRGTLPVNCWIGMSWLLNPESKAGQSETGVLSYGLLPFIGREVELQPSSRPLLEIAEAAYGVAAFLILNGPIVGDNELIRLPRNVELTVSLKGFGQRRGVPVVQLAFNEPQSSRKKLPGLGA